MNAHTNQMTQAFKQVGIKPATLTFQLWHFVKEEPGTTLRDIAKRAPHLHQGSVSATMRLMEKRGMIYSKPADIKHPRTKAFYTDMERFEMLSLPKEPKKPKNTHKMPKSAFDVSLMVGEPAAQPTPAPTVTNILTKAAIPSQDWSSYVDTLTIGQARGLYQHLHKMFGG